MKNVTNYILRVFKDKTHPTLKFVYNELDYSNSNEALKVAKSVAEKYNNNVMLFEEPTTAEHMVGIFAKLIEDYLHFELNVSDNVQLTKMVLYETADSYATFEKEYKEVI